MGTLQAVPIWPTIFVFGKWDDHAREAPGIMQHLYGLRNQEQDPIASGVARTAKTPGLFEGKFDLFASPHPGIQNLHAFVREAVSKSVAQINGEPNPALVDVKVVESWFHITNNSGLHDTHCHHMCSWCGIFYVHAGDPATPESKKVLNGLNRFYSPLEHGGGYCDFGNQYLQNITNYDVTPEDGWLVLFPAFLHHSALPYKGQKDRVVIAFNAQVNRKS